MMWRPVAVAGALLCMGLIGCKGKTAAPAAPAKIPQEEVDRKNPIESSPESIAEGKRLYGATDCALCHGKDGDGKGFLAKDASMNTHDWRQAAALAHFTDGEISYIIF
jgi:mono/diheme cytochrome c family protein